MFGWEWNGGGMEKVSLHKFTYISLLKNSAQLKPKKKKFNDPNYIKKWKSCLVKTNKKKNRFNYSKI